MMNALRSPVLPIDTYPVAAKGETDSWSGINKPVKVVSESGDSFVAKSNTYGKFISLHPDHDTRLTNVKEVVASHIVADELGLPTLTFQEGYLIADGQRTERILSPLCTNFKPLSETTLDSIKDGDAAVALSITLGWLGDHDTTFNDSNVWVRDDGQLMGADYGFSCRPGIEVAGVPFANRKVMNEFATRENVSAATERITALTDEEIHRMVERQGSRWIHDWNPAMEQPMAEALIANRDQLREENPYLGYVEGIHPLLHDNLLSKANALRFHWEASHSQLPPLNRPDQILDVLSGAARVAHLKPLANLLESLRS